MKKAIDGSPIEIVHGVECVVKNGQAYSVSTWEKLYLDRLGKKAPELLSACLECLKLLRKNHVKEATKALETIIDEVANDTKIS
jgi:hypothetical protein